MRFTVHVERTIEVLAENHQEARDRAVAIMYEGVKPGQDEWDQEEITLVEDENGVDEEGNS